MTSRTTRVKGKIPPGYDDEWEVSTVCKRSTNREEAAERFITGESVDLSSLHYYVTLRKKTP